MKTSFIIDVLVIAFASQAAASPSQRNDALSRSLEEPCIVNRDLVNTWVESGLTRHRIDVSTINRNVWEYCDYWDPAKIASVNPQCGFDDPDAKTGFHVDMSYARGPAGDNEFNNHYYHTFKEWWSVSGCGTGSNFTDFCPNFRDENCGK